MLLPHTLPLLMPWKARLTESLGSPVSVEISCYFCLADRLLPFSALYHLVFGLAPSPLYWLHPSLVSAGHTHGLPVTLLLFNSQNPGSLLTSTHLFFCSLSCGTNFPSLFSPILPSRVSRQLLRPKSHVLYGEDTAAVPPHP